MQEPTPLSPPRPKLRAALGVQRLTPHTACLCSPMQEPAPLPAPEAQNFGRGTRRTATDAAQ
eukprot:949770-Alexandrium_andersonii.AAC.1